MTVPGLVSGSRCWWKVKFSCWFPSISTFNFHPCFTLVPLSHILTFLPMLHICIHIPISSLIIPVKNYLNWRSWSCNSYSFLLLFGFVLFAGKVQKTSQVFPKNCKSQRKSRSIKRYYGIFFFFRFSNSLAKDMSLAILMSHHLFRLNDLQNQLVLNLRNCATTRTV